MLSVLFLAAEPTDASRRRLGEELREIQEKLQLSKWRDQFVLHERMSVRPADISQALLDVNPRIVHFSGHGTNTGGLCVENKTGGMHPIQPGALSALFEQFATRVECVILNACYSVNQAQALAKHIRYVIGTNQEIGDKAAIAFSVGFYQALGAGRSVEEAYKLGCAQILLENIPERLIPTLINTREPFETSTSSTVSQPEAGGVQFDDLVLRPEVRNFFETMVRILRDSHQQRKTAEGVSVLRPYFQASFRLFLIGPPGAGKTTIAKMIASESHLPLYTLNVGSLKAHYRGEIQSHLRDFFARGLRNNPCIVFLDEIECGIFDRSHLAYDDDVLPEVLVELENLASGNKDVTVIFATSRPERLDPALIRRTRPVFIGYPDHAGYEKLVARWFPSDILESGLSVSELSSMFENRSPRQVYECARSCLGDQAARLGRLITREVVQQWLIRNPISEAEIQRWKAIERRFTA